MSKVPRAMLDRYNQIVGNITDTVVASARGQVIATWGASPSMVKAIVNKALDAGNAATSEVDRDFYQTVRRIELGEARRNVSTIYRKTWTSDGVNRAVDAMYRDHGEYVPATGAYEITDMTAFLNDLGQYIGRTINEASKSHIMDYGERDNHEPKYARVPSGAETCAWCWSLAGLGFQYKSRETASHSHAHCDCVIVPQWGEGSVEGYDSEKYADMFRSAREDMESGNIPDELRDRINANAAAGGGYNRRWNGVLAVMRWKYGLT